MPEKLLYIEDNEAQQLAWEMVFRNLGGFEVDLASNGLEGLEKLNTSYSVIVLDMSLPKLNGLGFLDRLHSEDRYCEFRKIPIVVFTVWGDLQDVEQKCQHYHVKLISKEEDDEFVVQEIKKFIHN
ncbi:MAG: response regulator [Candidatus Zhuqueibacterota bacterium]